MIGTIDWGAIATGVGVIVTLVVVMAGWVIRKFDHAAKLAQTHENQIAAIDKELASLRAKIEASEKANTEMFNRFDRRLETFGLKLDEHLNSERRALRQGFIRLERALAGRLGMAIRESLHSEEEEEED